MRKALFLVLILVFAFAGRNMSYGQNLGLEAQASALDSIFSNAEPSGLRFRILLKKAALYRTHSLFLPIPRILDSCEKVLIKDLGGNEPRRAELHFERAKFHRDQGQLNQALSEIQMGLHRVGRGVDYEDLRSFPSPQFNRFDTLLVELLLEKSRLLFSKSRVDTTEKSNFTLAQESTLYAEAWLKEMMRRGDVESYPQAFVNLLKATTEQSLWLELHKTTKDIGLDYRRLELIGQDFTRLRNAMALRQSGIGRSSNISAESFEAYLKIDALVKKTRKELGAWVDANGVDNLQTTILRENIRDYSSERDESIDKLYAQDSSWAVNFFPKFEVSPCPNTRLRVQAFDLHQNLWIMGSFEGEVRLWPIPQSQFRSLRASFQSNLEHVDNWEGFQSASFNMYRHVFGPIHEMILEANQMEVISDGQVINFPFEVLLTNTSDKQAFLFKQVDITYGHHPSDFCLKVLADETPTTVFADARYLKCAENGVWPKGFNPQLFVQGGFPTSNEAAVVFHYIPGHPSTLNNLVKQSYASRLIVYRVDPAVGSQTIAMGIAHRLAGSPSLGFIHPDNCLPSDPVFTRFWKLVSRGKGKREALQTARIEFLETNPEKVHPKYWFNFQLKSDNHSLIRPIHSLSKLSLWFGLGTVLFVILWGAYRRFLA